MKEIEFVFDSVDLLYYKSHQVSLNRGGSYIDFPKWLKSKKATINSNNNDDKCFQHATTVALNHKTIVKELRKITKINPFTEQYSWKEINFPSHKKDCKIFESNNKKFALNILYVLYDTEKIRHAYISKHNSTRKNQVILLMITDNEK